MAKSKPVASVPAKAKSKTTKAAAPAAIKKANNLSEERITDSDDEDSDEDKEDDESPEPAKLNGNSKPAKNSKPAIAAPVEESEDEDEDEGSESGSEDSSEESDNDSAPNDKAAGSEEVASEDSDDSDSNEELGDAADIVKASGASSQVNGVKRKQQESSSGPKANAQDQETAAPAAKRVKTSSSSRPGASDVEFAPPEPIAAIDFLPPPGYTSLEASNAKSTFSAQRLQGKQIWHIIAPADVPLHKVAELSLDSVANNSTILTHEGEEYVLKSSETLDDQGGPSQHASNTALLLPDNTNATYTPSHTISATLHLTRRPLVPPALKMQHQALLPGAGATSGDTAGNAAAAELSTPSIYTIRPQPKGLRMRYKPPGFGSSDPGVIGSGSEDDDFDDESTSLAKRSHEKTAKKTSAKHKKTPSTLTKTTSQFPKTPGAHGTSIEQAHAPPASAQQTDNLANGSAEPSKKKKKKDKQPPPMAFDADLSATAAAVAAAPAPAAATALDEDLEKKKRKKEKKEKKEKSTKKAAV